MKTILKIAALAAFATLGACGSHNDANNSGTDLNAASDANGLADLNATDMNAMGNTDLGVAGADAGTGATNAAGNVTANNAAGNAY